MDDQEDLAIDPAIAAAMGFAGFGTQNKQKRKFNSEDGADGFVDPGVRSQQQMRTKKTGANSVPVRERVVRSAEVRQEGDGEGKMEEGRREEEERKAGTEGTSSNSSTLGLYDPKTQESPSLEVLKKGVRNLNGDLVIFLRGFVEDPWVRLK